jgi:hypothetical protein
MIEKKNCIIKKVLVSIPSPPHFLHILGQRNQNKRLSAMLLNSINDIDKFIRLLYWNCTLKLCLKNPRSSEFFYTPRRTSNAKCDPSSLGAPH